MKKRFLALLLCVLLGAMAISTASAETEDLYPDELSILAWLSEHISKVGGTSNNDNYVYQTIEEWTGTHVNGSIPPRVRIMICRSTCWFPPATCPI